MSAGPDGHSIFIRINDRDAIYPITVDPTWSQTDELSASDNTYLSQLGSAVAISGSTAVVGSSYGGDDDWSDGTAYIYDDTDDGWNMVQELSASDEQSGARFGASVAISGDTVLVGAPGYRTGDFYVTWNVGRAYAFTLSGGTWGQTSELSESDPRFDDAFGSSVALSGSTAIVGAPGWGGYIYEDVDIDEGEGAAFVFTSSEGSWTQSAQLAASDGAQYDSFGSSVALSGSTIVVGAPDHEVGDNDAAGAAYVFNGSGATWSQTGELTASDGAVDDELGTSVGISGATALAGAPGHEVDDNSAEGAVYVFTFSADSWSQSQELTPSDGATDDSFGSSVAISGSTSVIGASSQTVDDNYDQGAGYVFSSSAGSWSQDQEITSSDGASGDAFGFSVGISGANIVAGAPTHSDGDNTYSGSAYVFSATEAPVSSIGVGNGASAAEETDDLAGVARYNATCVQADPINCASGNFTEAATDVSVPGRGPELDLTRTYNSLDASTEGIFGYGWTSSYEMNLVTNEDSSVTITAGDGSQVTAEPIDDRYVMPGWSDSTLTHNEDDTWTYVRDNTETCTFNSSGELTEITDLNGYSETLSYTSGKLTTVTDASGRTLTFSYTDGLVSEVTDPDDQHTTYSYTSGNLMSVTDPMSRVTSYTYGDDDHLLLTVKSPNAQSGGPDAGDVLTNTYNDSGQVTAQTDPAGLETTFSYTGDNFSSDGGTTTITDPHGNVEVEDYQSGELMSDTKGYGTSATETWFYSYDPATIGETSVTDPNGNTTSSTYDSDGNLLTSTDALGNTTTYTYNSFDEPLTVTDPMGIETTYTYDDDGNLTSKEVTGSGGSPTRTTTYSYDDDNAGDVTSVTDPDDDVTDYTYDSYGDVATTTTNPGQSTVAYVQSGATDTDDGSIESGSSDDILSSDPTPGDALVALIYTFSGNDDDVTGVTGMGGIWHRGTTMSNDDANDDSGVIEIWYALDVAGGSKSLTVDGASGDWEAWVAEYSGVDPTNGFVSANSNYGSSTSPSVSLDGSAGDLAVVGSNVVGTSFSSSPSSPWSEGDSEDDFNNTFGRTAAYRVLSSSGSVTADWTAASSGDWGAVGILLAPTYQAESGIRYVTDGSTQSDDDGIESGQSANVLPEDSIPGDALVATIFTLYGNTDDVSSVTGLGGDWHRAASMSSDDTDDGEGDVEVWYALDITGGSEDLTVTGATGGWIARVGEYSGVDPTDGFVSASTGYGNSDAPEVTLSSVASGDLVVAADNTEGTLSSSPFSPWVEGDLADDFNGGFGVTAAYEVAASSGTATATWGSDSANSWATAGIVLAPSSGPRGGSDETQDVYDVLGRKVCEASPDATSAGVDCPDSDSVVPGTTTWTYDADSEVTAETDPDGNTTDYDYDADGNQTEVTDGLGNVTETTYDPDDRVTSVTQGYGTDSASTTSYTYDIVPDDCPSDPTGTTYCTETENGLSETTTSYYNALDQPIEQTPPNTTDQTAATYTYDPAGNVATKTDGSGVTTYSYDSDNRLVGISYSDPPSGMSTPTAVTYAYDDDGNRTEMTDGTGTTTYGYNSLEELDSVEDGDSNTVTYGYDADGNRTCLSYPNEDSHNCADDDSGTGIVTYSYDGAGELVSMSDWLGNTTTFSYDPDGNLTDTILPDGTNTIVSEAYDAADTLNDTSVDTAGTGSDLAALTRNADDLIASTTPDPDDSTTTYDYNPLNQVTTGLGADYTYDAAGEITSSTPNDESTVDYAYNSDGQLCWTGSTTDSCGSPPSGSTSYTYDVAGNRVSSTPSGGHPTTYGYDQAGNLVCDTAANASSYSCASPHSTVTSTYAYNGDDLRMSDTPASGSEQQFTWDTASSVPELLEDGANFYLYGPNVGSAPIEQITIDESVPSYLVSDTTGVREQLDSSGSVAGSMSYSSYGVPCGDCSIPTPFGYQGAYTDPTGMVYLVHRYYDPTTAQYLSVDADVATTGQPYEYLLGDPANNVDPTGTCTVNPDGSFSGNCNGVPQRALCGGGGGGGSGPDGESGIPVGGGLSFDSHTYTGIIDGDRFTWQASFSIAGPESIAPQVNFDVTQRTFDLDVGGVNASVGLNGITAPGVNVNGNFQTFAIPDGAGFSDTASSTVGEDTLSTTFTQTISPGSSPPPSGAIDVNIARGGLLATLIQTLLCLDTEAPGCLVPAR